MTSLELVDSAHPDSTGLDRPGGQLDLLPQGPCRRARAVLAGEQAVIRIDALDRLGVALDMPTLVAELASDPGRGRYWRSGFIPGPTPRITREAAHAAHKLHVAGMSIRELARRTWERYGYASASSCESGLHHAFRRYGFSRRSQADATALLPQRYVYRGGRTHGAVATYGAGCHCGPCRAAQAARMRRYRAERAA